MTPNRVYAICFLPEAVGYVISTPRVKTLRGYRGVNFEFSSFQKMEISHICDTLMVAPLKPQERERDVLFYDASTTEVISARMW